MTTVTQKLTDSLTSSSRELLTSLINQNAYVGEVFSLSYETALVQVNDFHRQSVSEGFRPSRSLSLRALIRIVASTSKSEDASAILLRVTDRADLPNEAESTAIRVELGQRVSGDMNTHWESDEVMDPETSRLLSFAGIKCRVVGTFYVREELIPGEEPIVRLDLRIRHIELLSEQRPQSL